MKMNSNFEKYILDYLNSQRNCTITDAMKYSMEGGKRFRARIIFAILQGLGICEEEGYDAGLALEMIQSYSLIHDDLPAMDNDDFRRGRPSTHKAFREDIAILAGDELLTDSFKVLVQSKKYDAQTKVNLVEAFSRYAGLDGMVYGQLLDVTSSSKDIDEKLLFEIQDNKTGGLFKIACLSAMFIGKIDRYDYYLGLGSRIGQIFQNQDDLFDMIRSEEETRKSNSDLKNDKGTALCLYSIDELKELIDNEFEELGSYLDAARFDTSMLMELIDMLKNR